MPKYRIEVEKESAFRNTYKYVYDIYAHNAESALEKAMTAASKEPVDVDVDDYSESVYSVRIDAAQDNVISLVK
jgi:hypothetical protein